MAGAVSNKPARGSSLLWCQRRQVGLLSPGPGRKETIQTAGRRFLFEQLVEAVLRGPTPGCDSARGVQDLARKVLSLDVSETRVVLLGLD
jgi:hypothetical protein